MIRRFRKEFRSNQPKPPACKCPFDINVHPCLLLCLFKVGSLVFYREMPGEDTPSGKLLCLNESIQLRFKPAI